MKKLRHHLYTDGRKCKTNTYFNEAVQVPQADFDRLARAKGSAKVEELVKAR